MKRIFSFIICLVLICSFCLCLLPTNAFADDKLVLRIYNWQDYIDDGLDENGNRIGPSLIDDFIEYYEEKHGQSIEVIYDTFETNEVMYNTLKSGKTTYDLVCPSDYMIQKMLRENMLEKFDYVDGHLINIPNYDAYALPFFKEMFEKQGWTEYAVGYFWGTMGYIYNPEIVSETDIQNWSSIWSVEYRNLTTIKDSVRDTYFLGAMYVYRDELIELKNNREDALREIEIKLLTNEMTEEEADAQRELINDEYSYAIEVIANRTDDETLEKIQAALTTLKPNLYGLEVDSGKNDMVTGKIAINFAWSGDAVYAIDSAEEEGVILKYIVPETGSNVWYDGWCMPKGANKELAQEFIDYVSMPENAVRNMDKVGYTTAIGGDAVLDYIEECYADEDGEYEVDLSHYFLGSVEEGRSTIVKTSELGRQFSAQYPDAETLTRCAVMKDFGDKNQKVLDMWENVKGSELNIWLVITVIGIVVLIILLFIIKAINKNRRHGAMRRRMRRDPNVTRKMI